MHDVTLPLAGIKVIEICNVAAGPFCAMVLADLGADVIKIENPNGGDTLRSWPPHSGPDGNTFSENFASLNRNKRSVTLDLKQQTDREQAIVLAADADVLLENNRPGVLTRLGLGYEVLRQHNPRLIYCSISAYGQHGPRADEGGFDVTVQAISGIMSVTGEKDGAPVKAGVPISDFAAGLYGAFAICAQLRRVAETGEGVHIDVPMMGASLAIAALQVSEYFGSGKDPVKLGSAHPRNAPYQAFKARDDYFVMAAGTQNLWETACRLLNREELIADPRFSTTALRARNQAPLKETFEMTFSSFSAQELIDLLSRAGIPCSLINSYSRALSDPQSEHMGWANPIVLANGVHTKTLGFPLQFNGKTPGIRMTAPKLGQDQHIISDSQNQGGELTRPRARHKQPQ
ncbi:CaiB/BaiF CoA transferase family protein [Ferrovibrio xuzhouensis]|uniref:CaiB/BaiF CoA transferase family protein n=1 Tax=Ferrovibrio xuzhouensis TaxID=1576914 RepID=A0ABV7VK16_9PROT